MLTIKKIDNNIQVAAYCRDHALTAPLDKPSQFMGLFEGDTLCGLGALTLEGTKVFMNFIHAEDELLIHGLAKALLNMADLRGIKTVYGTNQALESLYRRLRFEKTEAEYVLSLAGYFTAEAH
ncbi:MAG: GNAT family N-acetyltransferase [Ruminococcaceae bacterium]|nr:GNAT family N-acetyltransferase [Oscillospiraceae bacterium]